MRRLLLLGLVLCVVAVASLAFAGFAHAEDDPPAQPPVSESEADAKPDGQSEAEKSAAALEAFEQRLKDDPVTFGVLMGAKFGSILLGLLLLVWLYLRRDKIRGGVMPAPTIYPPSMLFTSEISSLLMLAWYLLPLTATVIAMKSMGTVSIGRVLGVTLMVATTLPIGLAVAWQKRSKGPPVGPGPGRAVLLGLGTFCVASVFVIPLIIVTTLVMQALGTAPELQSLVKEVIESPTDAAPLAIAVLGVFVAPFVEECVFRALLYPALKRWWGGTARPALFSALAGAALFAAIHQSMTMFFGLFALALVLTYVYEKTNSLTAIVIAHAANNFVALAPLLLLRMRG